MTDQLTRTAVCGENGMLQVWSLIIIFCVFSSVPCITIPCPARGSLSFGFHTHMHVQTHALARGTCKQIYIYLVIHTYLVNGVAGY